MARSISEIKKSMTDEFMRDVTIREQYGIVEGQTFSDCFSSVSIENILFYTVAACCHVLELLFDAHKAEVNKQMEGTVVASVPWYHKMALRFQKGYCLVFDEATQQFVYDKEDASTQIVKYAAVRDRGTSVLMLVSGEKNGRPAQLQDEDLKAFESYMNRIKIAGVVLTIRSQPADLLEINAKIYIDPLVIDNTGKRIADGSNPVELAVENYLKGIVYGGTFNKTKLVDAIQSVEGVSDVELGACKCSTDEGNNYSVITGNNYTAIGGSFTVSNLNNTLSYVVQY